MTKKRLLAWLLLISLVASLWILPVSAAGQTATVIRGWLRLRTTKYLDPTLQNVITRYYTGTTVTVYQQYADGWCYITGPDGQSGYVRSEYLSFGSGGSYNYFTPCSIVGHVWASNGMGVRLRSSPDKLSNNVMGLYPVGRTVQIIGWGNAGWHKVTIDGKTGYMMSAYILTNQPPLPAPTYYPPVPVTPVPSTPVPSSYTPVTPYTAYVTHPQGNSVNLRSVPSSVNNKPIASCMPGTPVTVLGYNGAWMYIRVNTNGITGFIYNTFLTSGYTPVPTATWKPTPTPTYVPYNYITGVQININYPKVGDVLFLSVTPPSAIYTSLWTRDDGKVLSTASFYTVQYDDIGHRIRLKVTGQGAYSGSAAETITSYVKAPPTPTAVPTATPTPRPTDPPTGSYTPYKEPYPAFVRGNNGYGVNLRPRPNTYDNIPYRSYPTNTAVTVLGFNGEWKYIRIDSDGSEGFMRQDYISETPVGGGTPAPTGAPSSSLQIEKVSISGSPTVNGVLFANVTPSSASYTCTWFRSNGVVCGTGNSYKVQSADVGFQIYCAVNGTGSYAGSMQISSQTNIVSGGGSNNVSDPPSQPSGGQENQLTGYVTLPSGAAAGMTLTPTVNVNAQKYTITWLLDGQVLTSDDSLLVNTSMAGHTIRCRVDAASGSGYTGSVMSGHCYVVLTGLGE